ncbi:MAG: hypothetical protein ACXVZ4_10425 [Gaiellaceae bacterium]
MRRKPLFILAVIALSGLVLFAAGCGGSKHKNAADTTATTTTEKTAITAKSDTTSKSSGFSGLANTKNCADLAGLSSSFAQAMSGTSTNDLKKTATLLKDFADKTPKDIRPDFEVLAAAYGKIADAMKGVNLTAGSTPDPAAIAKLTKLSSTLDTKALATASANISAWAQKNCTTK